MTASFNIGDVCKTNEGPAKVYDDLPSGVPVVIKERFGWDKVEGGYYYLAYNGIRNYILHQNQIDMLVSITSDIS